MNKHRRTRNRAIAVSAIASGAIGFGALSMVASPAAHADWWLLSGNDTLSHNGTPIVIGTNGNGVSNQNAIATGIIGNAHFNLFSLGVATVTNAAPATGGAAIGGAGTSAATEAGVPIGGLAVGGAAVNPAVGINLAVGGIGGSARHSVARI